MPFLNNKELLPSKDATFKQPSSNNEEDATFNQRRTAAIQGCNFKQLSSNLETSSQQQKKNAPSKQQRTAAVQGWTFKQRRVHSSHNNPRMQPSSNLQATFKQLSNHREKDALSQQQRTAAIQGCNLQTTFKQQTRGCNLQATKDCFHPRMQQSNNLQATFTELSKNKKKDAFSKQQRTAAIQGCNLQTNFKRQRRRGNLLQTPKNYCHPEMYPSNTFRSKATT